MKKLVVLAIICGLALGSLGVDVACAAKKQVKVLGIRIGSSGQMFATKVGEVINKNVPEVAVTVVAGSSSENPINVQKGRGEIGFTSAKYAYLAYKGEKKYDGMACPDLRFFFFFVTTLDNWIVRADSPIKKIEDLKDKKLCLGPKGYALTENALTTLKVYGLTPDTIRKNGGNVSFATDKDCARMMQDRLIDAMFVHTGKSKIIRTVLPLEETVGVRPLPYDRDKLAKIMDELGRGVIAMDIDGGVYEAEPNPVSSFGTPFIFVIDKDMPEAIVYKMTKAVWENQPQIREAVGPFYDPFKLENAVLGADIPIHPGALQYYKEKGLVE
ncbi:MAG: TAXI family TRAP transporter solute-binding subunit [Deltaproteobacteria bacterium]|nr:TAXI family TRAP transporter solute-binding subunit [Deltaproteobacteria bacterium]